MERNQAGRSWIAKALLFSVSASFAGMLSGAALGAAGILLPFEVRVAVASLLALVALAIGSLELLGRKVPLPQFDRETPQRWLHKGALTWALLNGSFLGVGVTSRIGFWLWYVVPLGAFLFADPALGAAIYGAYSVARGAAVWAIILGLNIGLLGDDWQERFIARFPAAQTIAACQLVLVGLVGTITIGL
ncbi:MAG: hypothetical protein IRY88_15715 [Rubrobacteraceae bacterium]|nr:hypothetical protein [Rubrobacteraceae bacterium]